MSTVESKKIPSVAIDNGETDGTGNVDKIRDILFGNQMRDYEKRFSRLEERLQKESAELREDLRRRFDSLEQFVRQEIESLTDRLQKEQQERTERTEDLLHSLKETAKAFEKRTGLLDEQGTKNHRDLRQQLLDQSKNLSDEIREKYDRLSSMLERSAEELREDKVDRSGLSSLFTELALRLTNQMKVPGMEDLKDE